MEFIKNRLVPVNIHIPLDVYMKLVDIKNEYEVETNKTARDDELIATMIIMVYDELID